MPSWFWSRASKAARVDLRCWPARTLCLRRTRASRWRPSSTRRDLARSATSFAETSCFFLHRAAAAGRRSSRQTSTSDWPPPMVRPRALAHASAASRSGLSLATTRRGNRWRRRRPRTRAWNDVSSSSPSREWTCPHRRGSQWSSSPSKTRTAALFSPSPWGYREQLKTVHRSLPPPRSTFSAPRTDTSWDRTSRLRSSRTKYFRSASSDTTTPAPPLRPFGAKSPLTTSSWSGSLHRTSCSRRTPETPGSSCVVVVFVVPERATRRALSSSPRRRRSAAEEGSKWAAATEGASGRAAKSAKGGSVRGRWPWRTRVLSFKTRATGMAAKQESADARSEWATSSSKVS
mmetsp:Transcript_22289/g.71840  ORF Transcript_22289/g.71840 Transcript_22289/m.71840 type:complete len:347 (-) Transcript_22289:661-1701(-)